MIRSELDDSHTHSMQRPDMDGQNMQRLMEEQNRLLTSLQKQLTEQTSIIQNQAAFISEIQERDRNQQTLLCESIRRIESDLSTVKGQLFGLEEKIYKPEGKENQKKSKQ